MYIRRGKRRTLGQGNAQISNFLASSSTACWDISIGTADMNDQHCSRPRSLVKHLCLTEVVHLVVTICKTSAPRCYSIGCVASNTFDRVCA
ncbi:hypothetical protein FHT76_005262 [Rhizobium sp. BK176]|nr:hypothetical protein [Rhizobium sp. BK176]